MGNELWENGQEVDEYDSCPGYFEADESRMEPEGGDYSYTLLRF